MKILKKLPKKKHKAQAMVEFALILPILMLVILGLMEAGRLLLIYGSVTTASREAVRYGSATGDNGSGTPKYLDCDGIRAEAQKMNFINDIDPTDIDIQYERGGVSIGDCNGAAYNGTTLENEDRIAITVIGNYAPMVPMGGFAAFPITTASKRTIFIGIRVIATAGPQLPVADLSFSKTADPTTFGVEGDIITYTFTLTNSGDFDLTGATVVDAMLGGTICSGMAISQGNTRTCTVDHTITSDNVTTALADANHLLPNTATATANASDGSSLTRTAATSIALEDTYEISLTKTPSKEMTMIAEIITYTYRITNIGNQDLTNFSVSDITNSIPDVHGGTVVTVSCPSTTLIPDDYVDCTSTYLITQEDLDFGSVINTATATAEDTVDGTNIVTETATATVITKPLILTVLTSPGLVYNEAGEEFEYIYSLRNVGTSDMSNFSIDDSIFLTGIVCPSVTLSPNQSTECTHNPLYIITQDNMDEGFIDHDIIAYADYDGGGRISSNLVEKITYADQDPELTLVKSGITTIPVEGDVITYTYTLTNTGDITLETPYTITDDKITDPNDFDCTTATSPLLPNPSLPDAPITAVCTGDYAVTADDIALGSITNTATVTAKILIEAQDGRQETTSLSSSYTVITYDGPRLNLDISATNLVLAAPINDGDTVNVDDIITFTYTLTNTGNTILTSVFDVIGINVTGSPVMLVSADCNPITSDLAPGESGECTSSYTVQSGDTGTITNAAIASASSGTVPSSPDSMSFTVALPICTAPEFSSGSSYIIGDEVSYAGATWEATTASSGNKIPGTTLGASYWTELYECTMP